MPGDLDKKIDRLYTVPLDEFVERRNELTASLRKDGDREAADEVKGLRKPTVPAWAVNQLARREKMRLRGLLTAGERLRKAHEKLLGGGSPEALQQARDDERGAIAELASAAASLLTEAGHPASEATLDRVRETLHAAAADEETGKRVRAGRLEREDAVTGFGFGSPSPSPRAKAAARQTKQDGAAREKRAREQKAEREKKARKKRRAEERLRDARSALREAERAVQRQARELERSEAALRRRQAESENAEQELEQARSSPGPG
jgi:hypothetical protein